ncbi:sialidase family protein [Candidatus Nitrosocosmicus hydrocola]|uniref:sialidase family protein n=1 Tax=Candidatus Nitrosocosmicus hydrocola TaxID=1826872 RepID=UPI0011E5A923|nr:sialidase family protein [Candidatus Nitrosocosmicus hydrocola]
MIISAPIFVVILGNNSLFESSEAQLFSPQVVATHNFTNGHNPSVAVNPNSGELFAVYTLTENNSTNIYITKSQDNGNSFSIPVRINDKIGDAADTWNAIPIRFGSNNEVYVAWMISKEDPDFEWGLTELRVSRSLDGGNSFSPAVNPVTGYKSEKAFFDLSVTGNQTLYLSFLDSLTNESDTRVIQYPSSFKLVKSVDGGKTFDLPSTLDNQNCVCCQTVSTVGPDGEIYFSWRDSQYERDIIPVDPNNPYNYGFSNGSLQDDFDYENYETIRDIVVRHTDDNGSGKKFSPITKVTKDKWYMAGCPDAGPGIAFDSLGRLHVAWFTGSKTASDGIGYYYAYSSDQGKTFSDAIPLLTDKEFIPPTQVSLGVDNNDNIWITFADQRSQDVVRYSEIKEDHQGKVHLSVINKNHQIAYNNPLIEGQIHEIVDLAMSNNDDKSFIGYRDGDSAKIAVVTVNTTTTTTTPTLGIPS